MASTLSIKDEAMKALEGSLATTLEHSKSLETKLSAAESELVRARAESAQLSRELQEQRAALAERDEQVAQLKAKAQESETESEKSRRRLVAMRQAGQAVVAKLGAAVLSAQEASAKPRPLEENLIPLATGEERRQEEQLRANFQAVFDAYKHTLTELEEQTESLICLGPAMGDLRDAMALKDHAESALPPGANQESSQTGSPLEAELRGAGKLQEAERAWRERCAAQGAAKGAANDTFTVVVPDDAQPGDVMTLTTQTGQLMEVEVPEGAEPGDTLTLAMAARS